MHPSSYFFFSPTLLFLLSSSHSRQHCRLSAIDSTVSWILLCTINTNTSSIIKTLLNKQVKLCTTLLASSWWVSDCTEEDNAFSSTDFAWLSVTADARASFSSEISLSLSDSIVLSVSESPTSAWRASFCFVRSDIFVISSSDLDASSVSCNFNTNTMAINWLAAYNDSTYL